jgi:hypothetical protein
VKRNQEFVEPRPFRSQADNALERSLEDMYRQIAIPELAEIVQMQQQAGPPSTTADDDDKQLR